MAASLDKILEQDEEGQAHEYLAGECPWYTHVHDGQWVTDPDEHCSLSWPDHQPLKSGAPRLVVKLTPRTPEASTVVKPTVPPGGPGLFHVKGMHLPPYMEHLWFHLVKRYGKHDAYRVAVGIVHKWAKGINPGGWKTKSGKGKRVHADVQAAAARNIAEWEADRARAHSEHAHSASLEAVLELAGAMNVGTVSTPSQRGFQAASSMTGKYSQYGLHQHPSQTVSPSPPLPPSVPVPTPAEVRAIIPRVPKCSQEGLSSSAKTFLETAAVKLEKDDEQGALASLRSAQSAVYSAHKVDLGPYMASVYNAPGSLSTTDARIIPAGRSSATAEMLQGRDRQKEWRALSVDIGALIDRLRKRYFHGHINGVLPNIRLTQEPSMSPLDKMLALAGAPVTTGKDVSFPTTTDTSQETRLLSAPDDVTIRDFKANQELSALPPLAKVIIENHLSSARDCLRRREYMQASACLAKACACARASGATHLLRELHRHAEAIAAGENRQHSEGEMTEREGRREDNRQTVDAGRVKLSATLR